MSNLRNIKTKPGFKIPWLLSLVLISLIIFTVTLGAIYSKIQNKKIRISEQDMLSAVVDLKVKQIVNWRQERKSDALIIQSNSSSAEFIDEYFKNKVHKSEIYRWIETFCKTNGYSSATIFDTNRNIRFSYGYKGDSIGHLGYELLAEVYKKHSYILSNLYFSEVTKTVTLNLLVPLIFWEQKNHPIKGVILFRIDPYKILYPLIQSWPTPSRSSETILLNREGNEVVFLNELRFQKGTALKLKFPITKEKLPAARAAKGFEGVFEGIDYRGVEVLAVTRTIPDSPWFIVGKVDRNEIYEPLYQQMRQYKSTITLLILIIAITLGLWWRNQSAAFYREKYHSELVLRDSEIKFRNLYNNTPVMLHSIDNEGYLLSVSDYWLKAMGYNRDEVIGRRSTDFLSEKSMRYAREKVLPDFMQNVICENIEYQFVKKNGEIIETLLSAVSERDETGQVIRSLAVITDITERKQAEEAIQTLNADLEQRVKERTARLEAANKELEAFSYSVSHDLRTPLRAIDGFSEILLENYSDVVDDQGKDYLNRVRTATQRMAQLIDNLLNLSRITRTEMTFKQVNLSSIASGIIVELQNIQPDRKVSIEIQPKVVAKGDAALLRYILDNLLGNAWKFTSKCETAKIEFGSKEINGKQTYFVMDNGAGFDMEYYDKLFGAFQRLHSASEFPGTGVGLATVQRIVHLHGGQVWAEGIPGKGATFYFTLS